MNREAVTALTSQQLELGESEAIVLAAELKEQAVFMEDERAVRKRVHAASSYFVRPRSTSLQKNMVGFQEFNPS